MKGHRLALRRARTHALAAALAALALGLPDRVYAASGPQSAAVTGRAASEYVRALGADGAPASETYAFGKGGHWSGGGPDPTIDDLSFESIARTLAPALASRGYLPSRDPKTTRLLVMVYWGTTEGTRDTTDSDAYLNLQASQSQPDAGPAPYTSTKGIQGTPNHYDDSLLTAVLLQNKLRDATDRRNAGILGYDTELPQAPVHNAFSAYRDSLITDIEYDRYFVVLMAYDFQEVWKHRNHRLLWETRFSVVRGSRDFGKALPALASFASHAFGSDTHGLIRSTLPDGRVETGTPTVIGTSEPPK